MTGTITSYDKNTALHSSYSSSLMMDKVQKTTSHEKVIGYL